MLATFLGLVSASILPTISLLIGSMTVNGRSVLALNELKAEISAATDALFLLFGCVGVVIVCLVALATPTPGIAYLVPYLAEHILPRSGQAIACLFSALILIKSGQIPAIIRRTLEVRHKIAVEEARKKLGDAAPDETAIRQAFATHPEFGKVIAIDERRS